jgi:hypothetical protein
LSRKNSNLTLKSASLPVAFIPKQTYDYQESPEERHDETCQFCSEHESMQQLFFECATARCALHTGLNLNLAYNVPKRDDYCLGSMKWCRATMHVVVDIKI